MPKGKGGLAIIFGPKSGGAAPEDEAEADTSDDEYADDEKTSLYKAAFGKAPTPEQLDAFHELVRACMESE